MSAPMPQSPTPAPASRLNELSARATLSLEERVHRMAMDAFFGNPDYDISSDREDALRLSVGMFEDVVLKHMRSDALAPTDQTERERVIEECARVAEIVEATWLAGNIKAIDRERADVARNIAAAIRTLTAERSGAPASEWRPISEAPKDGTTVDLLANDRRVTDARFYDGKWIWGGGRYHVVREHPTHWMPLPPPPSPSSAGGRS